jgi:CheY-like chemotaxis protein
MSRKRHQQVLNELVDWLVGIESLAHDVYKATADALAADRSVSSFVARLADDEQQHAELITGLKDLVIEQTDAPPPDMRLDAALRESVETPLRRLQADVAAGTITRKRAMSLIADVEFTEWNPIFLYVVGTFGRRGRTMEKMSATIQEHKRSIEAFIATLPPHLYPERDLAKLAKIWDTRLLIVDDSSVFLELLQGLLKPIGQVIAAESGEEALVATRSHFFDAVVSDIQMPGISGIEFYHRAVAEHPDLQNRFVFISFDPSRDTKKYLTDHNLPLLVKPFSPEELTVAVHRITSAVHSANMDSGGDVR